MFLDRSSNIFNIVAVLSISSIIQPISVSVFSVYDGAALIVTSLITWLLARTKYEISRKEGTVMVLLYLGYVVYIIMR